jgi:hypothetical protein
MESQVVYSNSQPPEYATWKVATVVTSQDLVPATYNNVEPNDRYSWNVIYGRKTDVSDKIRSFSRMDDAWFGEGDTIPPKDGLDWLADAFEHRFCTDNPLPNVFPTSWGGVRMEWRVGNQTMLLDIDLSFKTATWLSFDLDEEGDDSDHDESIDLSGEKGWDRLDILLQTKPFTG